MKWNITRLFISALALCGLPVTPAAAAMTPGLYEYTIKMNMPGGPANMPVQTSRRCLSAKDLDSNKAFEMPPVKDSDCQMKDLVQSGGQFSYRVSCTKPEKIDSSVKGTLSATSMTMEMTTLMPNLPGPMTQTITARRLGDCKQP